MKTAYHPLPFAVFAAVTITSPALATFHAAPAPIAGLGFGAVALVGFGYRAIKNRIDR